MASYESNYLNKVIFNLSYNEIDSLKTSLDESFLTLCQEQSDATVSKTGNLNINFSMAVTQGNVITQIPVYNFFGATVQIAVTNTYLQIISSKYTTHQVYHQIISKIFTKFKEIYTPKFTRVALRYINIISFPDGNVFDFNGFIHSSLIAATDEFKSENLSRSLGSMVIKDDDITTNFTYGYFNSLYPNPISKREFTLDYDCFITLIPEGSDISAILGKLRNKVNTLFEKSILQALRTKMIPQNT